jgi:hypothetical protein
MVLYNPNADQISYTMKYLRNKTIETTFTGTINSKKAVYTPVVPTDSGAIVASSHSFVALTVTDSEEYNSLNGQGATYNWGFAAVPTNLLTPEVVVGLGWGCLNNACGKTIARNVVWVT